MRREEVIAAIERVQLDSLDVGERARLMGMLHFQSAVGHMAPVPMGVVFGQSMRCAWLIVRRLGKIDIEEARRFRQREQFGAFLLVMSGYLGISLFIAWGVMHTEHLVGSTSSVPIILLGGLGVVGGGSYLIFLRMIICSHLMMNGQSNRKARSLNRETMHGERFQPWCVGCGYELKGLESALGDELWVGPTVCPECGIDYPAIGE